MKFATNHAAGQTNHPQVHNRIGRALNYRTYTTLADDTMTAAELQAALDEGGIVAIPPGVHTLTADVTVRAGVVAIEGNGATLQGGGLILDSTGGAIQNLSICDLTINGAVNGIACTGSTGVTGLQMHNVELINCTGAGLYTECEFTESGFYNVRALQSQKGMHFAGTKVHNALSFYACIFSNNIDAGLYLDSSSGAGASGVVNIYGGTFQGNRAHAIRVNRTQNLLISGGYFELNNYNKVSAADILLEGIAGFATQYITIQNCRFAYDLGPFTQQPQVFVECAGQVRELMLMGCEFMNDARNGGGRLKLDGNDVTLIATPLLESLIVDAGTVRRL